MTQVIKRSGSKENFNIQKLRKSIENAVSQAGFSVNEKMDVIEHATQDAENLVREMNEVRTTELRNEIINDLKNMIAKLQKPGETTKKNTV